MTSTVLANVLQMLHYLDFIPLLKIRSQQPQFSVGCRGAQSAKRGRGEERQKLTINKNIKTHQ